jgi:hypothetical protein
MEAAMYCKENEACHGAQIDRMESIKYSMREGKPSLKEEKTD